jgi:hypothetical protein
MRAFVAAVVGIVVVLGAVALAVARTSGGDDEERIALGPAEDGVVAVPGFAPRSGPAVTTVDGSLFVFGGFLQGDLDFDSARDGLLVAPDFASAELITDAPFDPPLYGARALGVGGRILVTGVSCDVQRPVDEDSSQPVCEPGTLAAAVLDLRDGRREWRRVDLPEPVRDNTQASAGHLVDLLGPTSDGRAVAGFGVDGFWAFDPDTDAWEPIEGARAGLSTACVAGDRLVVLRNSPADVVLASHDVVTGGAWVVSPPLRRVGGGDRTPELLCLGDRAAVMDPPFIETLQAYSFASGAWTTPPTAPRSEYYRDKVWTGEELVFLPTEADVGAPGIAYSPVANNWRTISGFPKATRGARWSGEAIVGYSEPMRVAGPTGMTSPGIFRLVP